MGNNIPGPLPCSGGGSNRNWYYWLKILICLYLCLVIFNANLNYHGTSTLVRN